MVVRRYRDIKSSTGSAQATDHCPQARLRFFYIEYVIGIVGPKYGVLVVPALPGAPVLICCCRFGDTALCYFRNSSLLIVISISSEAIGVPRLMPQSLRKILVVAVKPETNLSW